MSAVDAPPGIGFAGRAAGEFVARPASLRLARRALGFALVTGVMSFGLIVRRGGMRGEALLAGPLIVTSIALVCYAVRRARLRIDGSGVRWGWSAVGFRVVRDRLAGAVVYDDAIAFRRPRGGPWYLAGHDFAEFAAIPAALRAAGIPFERKARRAPWRSRLQTYGVALDVLIVLDAVFAAIVLVLATG